MNIRQELNRLESIISAVAPADWREYPHSKQPLNPMTAAAIEVWQACSKIADEADMPATMGINEPATYIVNCLCTNCDRPGQQEFPIGTPIPAAPFTCPYCGCETASKVQPELEKNRDLLSEIDRIRRLRAVNLSPATKPGPPPQITLPRHTSDRHDVQADKPYFY